MEPENPPTCPHCQVALRSLGQLPIRTGGVNPGWHVFLGELLRGLWRKNVRDLEVLRPEVDNGGYDLALVFRGLTRHVQLKSSYRGRGVRT